MKNILSLALAVRREIRDRDDVGLLRLLELAVPVVALMVALGGDRPADAGYWLMAGAFTLLVTLFVAGLVIQQIRAARANH
jgi:hypothetical protein